MNEDNNRLILEAQSGNKASRDEVFHNNIGLIWSIVKRFTNRGYDSEELFQIGSIGLIKAIDKFDMSYNVKFSTYAVPMIIGEIKRFLRDDGIIKVSRSLKELNIKVNSIREKLRVILDREPTIDEISKELDVKVEDIIMAIEASSEVDSLNKTVYQAENKPIYLIDKLKSDRDDIELMTNTVTLKSLLNDLSKDEQEIIYLRYFKDKTQNEVAKRIGISQVQVSRIEKKILIKMREKICL